MKKLKTINIYKIVAGVVFVIGLFFTYMIAELDDAPGFIIIGTAINSLACTLLWGLGTLIEKIKINNEILENIYKEMKEKSNIK